MSSSSVAWINDGSSRYILRQAPDHGFDIHLLGVSDHGPLSFDFDFSRMWFNCFGFMYSTDHKPFGKHDAGECARIAPRSSGFGVNSKTFCPLTIPYLKWSLTHNVAVAVCDLVRPQPPTPSPLVGLALRPLLPSRRLALGATLQL